MGGVANSSTTEGGGAAWNPHKPVAALFDPSSSPNGATDGREKRGPSHPPATHSSPAQVSSMVDPPWPGPKT